MLESVDIKIFADFCNDFYDFQGKNPTTTGRPTRIFDAERRENVTDTGAVLVKGSENFYVNRFLKIV